MSYNEEQIEEKREAFALFDRVGDGKINSADLGKCLRSLGLNPTEAEVKKLIADIDPSGKNRIAFESIIPVLQAPPADSGKVEDFIEGLRVFDKDGNGSMNVGELRHVLTSLGERLSDEDVDQLLLAAEVDKEGNINYEKFVRTIMSG